jgi:hypothetical protein
MTEQRKLILVGGAIGAYLLLKPKTGGAPSPLSKALTSALAPFRASPTSTNLATGGGTRALPLPPASGQSLYSPAQQAQLQRQGGVLTPAQRAAQGGASSPIGTVVAGGVNGLISGLANLFRPKPPTQNAPSASKPGSSTSAPSGGGSSGGSSGGGRFNTPGIRYDPYSDPANYDAYGNYVGEGAWDSRGNYIGPGDPATAGIFDPNAPTVYDYVPGGSQFTGPIDQPGFVGPIDQPGYYDPYSDPANYDSGGSYVGEGAWDDAGNYIGSGDASTAGYFGPIDENGQIDYYDDYGVSFDDGSYYNDAGYWGGSNDGNTFVGPVDEFTGPLNDYDPGYYDPQFDPAWDSYYGDWGASDYSGGGTGGGQGEFGDWMEE